MVDLDVALRAPYDLDDEVVAAFGRDGHVLVPGLLAPELVAQVRPAVEATAAEHNLERRPMAERDTYSQAFLQTINLWRHDDVVRRFVLSPRFAEVAARLLGVPSVRLYHDQSLVKEPGGGATPWHQDQFYWPFATPDTVTLWMPLADVDPAVGSMSFASGSHRAGSLCDRPISDESQAEIAALLDSGEHPVVTHGALRAGDATFHRGWTLHGAGPNPTDAARPVMTVIYVAADAVVAEPANVFQEFDRQMWLEGREPGQAIDGESNPVLWPAGGA